MTTYVVDASAAVEYLLRTPLGLRLAPMIEEAFVLAPELVDAEVLSVLRRGVLRREIEEQRATLAVDDLREWPLERIPHRLLIEEAWQRRHHLSAYDAFYVAAASLYDAPLLTTDGPLSRAPGLGVVVQNVRMG